MTTSKASFLTPTKSLKKTEKAAERKVPEISPLTKWIEEHQDDYMAMRLGI